MANLRGDEVRFARGVWGGTRTRKGALNVDELDDTDHAVPQEEGHESDPNAKAVARAHIAAAQQHHARGDKHAQNAEDISLVVSRPRKYEAQSVHLARLHPLAHEAI